MVFPVIVAVIIPVLVGFILGPEALGGLLISSLITGFLLALTMNNSGAIWDNAKIYIERGNFGGRDSDAYKASVIGDMVGDPLKDAAGPSINILLKLVVIIALIIAPFL
jgi:K(+)-stimulated pyrophosphate-energized sodium pump